MLESVFIDAFACVFAGLTEADRLRVLKRLESLHVCEEVQNNNRIVICQTVDSRFYKAYYYDSSIRGVGLGLIRENAIKSLKRVHNEDKERCKARV